MKKIFKVVVIGCNSLLASYGAYSFWKETREKREEFGRGFREGLQKDFDKLATVLEAIEKRNERDDIPVINNSDGENSDDFEIPYNPEQFYSSEGLSGTSHLNEPPKPPTENNVFSNSGLNEPPYPTSGKYEKLDRLTKEIKESEEDNIEELIREFEREWNALDSDNKSEAD